jgi:hypothetical protein
MTPTHSTSSTRSVLTFVLMAAVGGCAAPSGLEVVVEAQDLRASPTHLELTLYAGGMMETHGFDLTGGVTLPGVLSAGLPEGFGGRIDVEVLASDADITVGAGTASVTVLAGMRAEVTVTLQPPPPPQVSSVCPRRVLPGDAFEIMGQDFQPGAMVTVEGVAATVDPGGTSTRLVAHMPTLQGGQGGSFAVTVTNPDQGQGSLDDALIGDDLTGVSLSTYCGGECSSSSEQRLRITGNGFVDGMSVTVNGSPVDITSTDNGEIDATAPGGHGNARVQVCYPVEQCPALDTGPVCHDAGSFHY